MKTKKMEDAGMEEEGTEEGEPPRKGRRHRFSLAFVPPPPFLTPSRTSFIPFPRRLFLVSRAALSLE